MHNTLQLVLVLLAVAVMVVVLCRTLKLPVILGYLTVGIAIGPHALGWIPDTQQARHLAEFGVVFLMFSIGLEFSLAKLRSMKVTVFGLGGAQLIFTLAGVAGVALLLGLDWRAGIALGGVLAMSSTAIVSKILVERAELNAPHGQLIMGVLLFQDLAVVLMLIIIPALAILSNDLVFTLGSAVLKAALVLGILLLFGQRLMRPWFHLVARQKSSELFMLNVLLITLGLAYFTELAGLSLALGAFVAGMLIAETEYRYQVEDDIKPFRDILMGLFFVTIGMLLNLRELFSNLGWVLLLMLSFLLFKAGIVALLGRWYRGDWGVGIRSGLGLAQAGEFGFVLLTLSFGANLLTHEITQIVLAAMLLSMLVAPFLIQYSDAIVRHLTPDEWMSRAMQMHQISVRTMATSEHIIVCGYGRSGHTLAQFLAREDIPYVALDFDARHVRQSVLAGNTVVYGDASKREVLMAAGLMRAKVLVVTYDDEHSALKILHHVKSARPGMPVVVRTADDSNVEKLKQAGATEVVAEVLEGTVMLASQALLLSGVPFNRVIRRIQESRARHYSVFRGQFHTADDRVDEVTDSLQASLHSVILGEHDFAVSKTLDELDLAGLHVVVNVVRRNGAPGKQAASQTINQPSGDIVLKAGDVLMLLGQKEGLIEAEKRLHEG
jgi:CPA2 family monovalent cation:H+ antiporter-2